MKIAIITIHRVLNFGAILQAFALKEVLSKYGTTHIIDYRKKSFEKQMRKIRFEFSFHGLKMMAHDLLNFRNRKDLINKFQNFIKRNMNLTQKFDSGSINTNDIKDFDVYVSGSDQIWNPLILGENNRIDPNYFLSFAKENSKKVAYASSMGNYLPKGEMVPKYKKFLSSFHRISTREVDGVKKLKEILPERRIDLVVDPSLLLTKRQWLERFDLLESKPIDDNYLLVYSVPKTDLLKKAVLYFAKKTGLKVIAVDRNYVPMPGVDIQMRGISPIDFLALYRDASFVVTDSFHGTCFAVNFEVPFACIAANNKSNRQESLLSQLKLSERLLYREEDFEELNLKVDFVDPAKQLVSIRKKSLAFIDSSIKGESA